MSKPIQDVSERMRKLLELNNEKLVDMAERTGINKGTLAKYLNGKMGMKQDRLEQIAAAYNVDPVWLLGYDVPMLKQSTVDQGKEYAEEQVNRLLKYAELLEHYEQLSDDSQKMIYDLIKKLGGDQNG